MRRARRPRFCGWFSFSIYPASNLSFASADPRALQAAFDPARLSSLPYTVVLAPNGKILFEKVGNSNVLELRRTILANMPGDYVGF